MSKINVTFDSLVIMFVVSIVLAYPIKIFTGISLYPVFFVLTLLVVFVLFFLGKTKISVSTLIFVLFGFSVLTFVTLCQGNPDIKVFTASLFCFVFFPVLMLFISKKLSILGYNRLVNTIVFLAIMCGFFGVIQYIFKLTYIPAPEGISVSERYFRPISFFSSTQQFAAFMLFAFCVSIVNGKSKKVVATVFFLGSLSLSMVFFFGSIFFVFCYLLKNKPLRLFFSIFCIPFAIVFLNFLSNYDNGLNSVRFLQPLLFNETISESNAANSKRIEIWSDSIKLVETPIYGVDLSLSNPYVNSSPLNTESYYISLYVNGGFSLMLLSFATILFLLYKSRSIYSIMIAVIYIFIGLSVHVLYALSVVWIFVFICRSERSEVFSSISNYK